MANYQEARVKPTNTQLNKLKSAAKKIRQEQHYNYIRKTLKMKNCHMNYF